MIFLDFQGFFFFFLGNMFLEVVKTLLEEKSYATLETPESYTRPGHIHLCTAGGKAGIIGLV